ncbi:uncharacterized protein FIBRA_05627 [Fibroporia radiculosa]|uniref:Uncharacterized protein n=1 Tax=Fibroporia radiculosa TaxID=599839 RepID=J4G9U3_9APHY|nr:uncharacterized protein FIBRA_05627 [Fibroporia radiculosa]CCM03493.1 predicted protein [Fibroporia radiculosa]
MSLRQRIPFRFSENDQSDDHILDEQEQEELIESLRRQSRTVASQYVIYAEVILGLSCLLHVIFLFKQDKESPLYALLPTIVPTAPLPLAALFAVLHIALHLNLGLLLLPYESSIIRWLASLPPPLSALPIVLSHPICLVAPALAPALSLLLLRGWPETVWWSVAGAMTWFVYTIRQWPEQSEDDIRQLENMRYDARGV